MVLMDVKGTTNNFFQIKKNGPKLKNVLGEIQARNASDGAFADLYGNTLKAASDSIQINADATSTGANWRYDIARPIAGMTSNLTLVFPPDNGSVAGKVMTTDGSGNMTWAFPIMPLPLLTTFVWYYDSITTIPPIIPIFTLPANCVIDSMEMIIDTPDDSIPPIWIRVYDSLSNQYFNSDPPMKNCDLTSDSGDGWISNRNYKSSAINLGIFISLPSSLGSGAGRIVTKYYKP